MFESSERLGHEIAALLDGLREEAGGRYACLLDPQQLLFETAGDEPGVGALREILRHGRAALFALPGQLAGEGPSRDLFEGWDADDLFLAFVNGRVALVLACPDAESLRERLMRPLEGLADRLFRLEPRYRLDERGRGLFFGGARLDLVVVGRAPDRVG